VVKHGKHQHPNIGYKIMLSSTDIPNVALKASNEFCFMARDCLPAFLPDEHRFCLIQSPMMHALGMNSPSTTVSPKVVIPSYFIRHHGEVTCTSSLIDSGFCLPHNGANYMARVATQIKTSSFQMMKSTVNQNQNHNKKL
jgi:hypothetical protein